MKITNLVAREIIDSRGFPTIECQLFLDNNNHAEMVTSSVPNGISCGPDEAHLLLDGGQRYSGFGVQKAVALINTKIAPLLISKEPNLYGTDLLMRELDGTHNKSVFGANSMLAVSMAVCRAQAVMQNISLPQLIRSLLPNSLHNKYASKKVRPCFNVVNGGMHAVYGMKVQEIMVIPPDDISYLDQLEIGMQVTHRLQKMLIERGVFFGFGAEGGVATSWSADCALKTVFDCIEMIPVNNKPIEIALDVAAFHLFDEKTGLYDWDGKKITAAELFDWYCLLSQLYPIAFIEDPFAKEDLVWWQKLQAVCGKNSVIVGDDLFVTDAALIDDVSFQESAHGVIIKPNQRGTVTETLDAVAAAYKKHMIIVASHRSRETNDSFIADFAVGAGAAFIKAGCLGGERMSKYNRLQELYNL